MVEFAGTCAHDSARSGQRFQKVPFLSVHTNAFSNLSTLESVFKKFRFRCSKISCQYGRKAKPDKNVAFSDLSGLGWTEPYFKMLKDNLN